MKSLYIAGQNPDSREWVPVAQLRQIENGFELIYTKGARRLPSFAGLSRMQDLEKSYFSSTLFPFFANRLIPKSRPEFKSYLSWLGLTSVPESPLDLLAISGGVRATDNYELFSFPDTKKREFQITFFPRGLRHQLSATLEEISRLKDDTELFLMKDVQNIKDPNALAIRSEVPCSMFVGYVPRYYSPSLSRLLDEAPNLIKARIKRTNPDAPQDMKILVSLDVSLPTDFDFSSELQDFQPLSATLVEHSTAKLIQATSLEI
jgi:hypothetical protein